MLTNIIVSQPLNRGEQIRLATAGDAPAIARVLAEAFAAFKPAYTPEAYAATTPGAEQIVPRLGEGAVWVAEVDGAILGTVSVTPRGDGLYLRSLAVLPAARGRRLGEALVRQAEAYAMARGLRRVFLSTTPVLTEAIRLYERLGFVRSDDGPHDLYGTPLFTMIKEL